MRIYKSSLARLASPFYDALRRTMSRVQTRRLARLGSVLVAVLAVSAPTVAFADTPATPGRVPAAAGPVVPDPPSPTPPQSASSAPGLSQQRSIAGPQSSDASCDAVKDRLAELAKSGRTSVACINSTSTNPAPSGRSSQADVSTQASVAHPTWCDLYTDWKYDRKFQCKRDRLDFTIFDTRTGAQTGTLNVNRRTLSYTAATSITWGVQTTLSLAGASGSGYGTVVRGDGICKSPEGSVPPSCTGGSQTSFGPSPALNPNFPFTGETYFNGTSTNSGAVGFSKNSINLTFTNSKWSNSLLASETPPTRVRCDNALPGRGAGCVFSDYVPAVIYSVSSSEIGEFAKHVRAAQNSGLPGAYPSGTPLTRLTDRVLIDRNGTVACKSSYTRPTGSQCDEYPFRSTFQGASTGGGNPRTFSSLNCRIPQVGSGSGPAGYSVCMIAASHNTDAGTALGTFYNENRVISADPFRVWIQN